MIADAKKEGLQITCSVTPYHLFFTEEDLKEYNTLLKVFPPLRTKKDQEAILKAVENGTVDCISSHHLPQNWDGKTIEFENAKAGIACIETSFSAVLEKLPNLSEEKIAAFFSNNARQIFNLPTANIVEGVNAELTLFNVNETTKMSHSSSASKSANSPFWDLSLKGRIIGTVVKNTLHINS
jgi:dihydroorotase